MKPSEYRKWFGIHRCQPVVAKAYSERCRQMVVEYVLGENLSKARATRGKKAGK